MAAKNGKPKPKMLKEFLRDDTPSNYKSSNGFKPNNPCGLPDNNSDPTTTNNLLRSRSRSRAAAYAAVSPFQKVLNAVKSFHYSSTPSTLQRSVSRRLLGKWNAKKRSNNSSSEVMSSKIVVVTVKVKDILRWRSFRDLVVDHQDESQPSDVVGSTDAPPSTSNSNSCVESDFTDNEEEEELPRWWSDNSSDDDEGEKWDKVVASDSEVGPTEDYHKTAASEEGTEQQSPVSVLGSPFRDEEVSDEEFPSTFEQSLANMERTKQRFLQSIQLFESLAGVHDDEDDETAESIDKKEDDKLEATSKACLKTGFCWFERGEESLKDKKDCIQGMEMQGKWSKFEEERTEVGVDLEVGLLNDLFDEILFDL